MGDGACEPCGATAKTGKSQSLPVRHKPANAGKDAAIPRVGAELGSSIDSTAWRKSQSASMQDSRIFFVMAVALEATLVVELRLPLARCGDAA